LLEGLIPFTIPMCMRDDQNIELFYHCSRFLIIFS
jgi:hypothetical protein